MKIFYYYTPKRFWKKGYKGPIDPYEIKAENEAEARRLIRERFKVKSTKGFEIFEPIYWRK